MLQLNLIYTGKKDKHISKVQLSIKRIRELEKIDTSMILENNSGFRFRKGKRWYRNELLIRKIQQDYKNSMIDEWFPYRAFRNHSGITLPIFFYFVRIHFNERFRSSHSENDNIWVGVGNKEDRELNFQFRTWVSSWWSLRNGHSMFSLRFEYENSFFWYENGKRGAYNSKIGAVLLSCSITILLILL